MMNENNAGNIIDALSGIIGLQNLFENRAQTAHNDVQAANDKQAEYLLSEINKRFDEQNKLLRRLVERLEASKGDDIHY